MRKVVFLPLSPNMWEGFETLYDKESLDPYTEIAVVPIPSYGKMYDGALSEPNYTTAGYPEYLNVYDVNSYNFEKEHPDVIYMQNVEDKDNPGFTVHPFFFTSNLRSFTDEIVYVPYNCFSEVSPDYEHLEKNYKVILLPSGIINADRVIVQSENMINVYLKLLSKIGEPQDKWESRISFEDYPRKAILKKYSKETIPFPESWDRHLFTPDGNLKEILLYVNSAMGLLEFGKESLQKARKTFESYLDKKDKVAIIWRPHKNLPEVISKLRPELFDDFRSLLEFYIYNDVGIFDETPTPTPAIILSDSYAGDECGIKELFLSTGKPVIKSL